jgi:hypothetical protein
VDADVSGIGAETCAKAGCDAACQDTGERWAPRCCALRPGGVARLTLPRRPATAINAEHEIFAGKRGCVVWLQGSARRSRVR